MGTLPGKKPPARQVDGDNHDAVATLRDEDQGTKPKPDAQDVVRTTMLISGGAVGVILAITVLSAWRDTGAMWPRSYTRAGAT
jgi:hypothetical protein